MNVYAGSWHWQTLVSEQSHGVGNTACLICYLFLPYVNTSLKCVYIFA